MLLNIEIQFHRDLSAEDVAEAIERIEATIRDNCPDIHNIFVEAKSLTGHRRE